MINKKLIKQGVLSDPYYKCVILTGLPLLRDPRFKQLFSVDINPSAYKLKTVNNDFIFMNEKNPVQNQPLQNVLHYDKKNIVPHKFYGNQQKQYDQFVTQNGGIILNMMGNSSDSVFKKIKQAKQSGYDVLVNYIIIQLSTLLKRNKKLPIPFKPQNIKKIYYTMLKYKNQCKSKIDQHFAQIRVNDEDDIDPQIKQNIRQFLQMSVQNVKSLQWNRFNQNLLKQNIFDNGNFKCVFLAGSPAAGKTTVMTQLFDVDLNMSNYGLRIVNADYAFVKYLQKAKLPLDTRSTENSPEIKQKQNILFYKAKNLVQKQFDLYISQRKGIIVDLTGNSIEGLEYRKNIAQSNGYDTLMVYVSTSLQTALRRNAKRDRRVQENYVKEAYNKLQINKKIYKSIFGSRFIQVENQDNSNIDSKIRRIVTAFVNSPIKNEEALQWLDAQRKFRNITKI